MRRAYVVVKRTKGIFKDKRGISPLIALLIVVVIAVIGGAVTYYVIIPWFTRSMVRPDARIEITLYDNGDLAITVQNTGTGIDITSVTLKDLNVGGTTVDVSKVTITWQRTFDSSNPLKPGETISGYATNVQTAPAGTKYSGHVTVTWANGMSRDYPFGGAVVTVG